MFQISNTFKYSAFSIVRRSNLLESFKELYIVDGTISLFKYLRIEINENPIIRERTYRDFERVFYLNYISIESLKLIIKDLFISYQKEYPHGTVKTFIQNNFRGYINELTLFNKLISEEHIDEWFDRNNLHFYRYINTEPLSGFSFFILKNDSLKDLHFCQTYIESILTFFKKEIYSFLSKKNEKSINSDSSPEYFENAHQRIFKNSKAYILFINLKKKLVNPKHLLADHSFIYRRMLKDGLIHKGIKDSEFREWLNDNFQITIDKTKQLHNCSTEVKEKLYSEIKDQYKPY